MNDATTEFFNQVKQRGHFRELEKGKGTLRIDLKGAGQPVRWIVQIDRGDVIVSHKNGHADCILQADKATFDRVVTGRTNAMAAFLRGSLSYEGDAMLMVLFQRLLPASPESRVSQKSKGRPR